MGAGFSRRLYVWFREYRYKFNEAQAKGEYWNVPSLFGLRTEHGKRTMTEIVHEIMTEKKIEAQAVVEEKQNTYTAVVDDERTLYASARKRLPVIRSQADMEAFKKSELWKELSSSLVSKGKEVKEAKNQLRKARKELRELTNSINIVNRTLKQVKTSDPENKMFKSWETVANQTLTVALEKTEHEEDNSVSMELQEKVKLLEEREDEKLNEDEDEEVAANDDKRILEMLFGHLKKSNQNTSAIIDLGIHEEEEDIVFNVGEREINKSEKFKNY